ncbi:alpha/beta hydrolase [Kitasatospora sp. A2-31]|uniref:alpha/beta hydrolase n=1 Tax=Kitasatospora sp. A2-31 TaxID=2916414 RepID=UPI001EECB711|nr:alpha/beta hydrolase [Kitasatospora sp. A2-31]MCG6494850.1 alpha/beta hydrolase [Kitasatospora sp. A2-31]
MDPAVALIRTTLNTASLLAPGAAGRAAFALFRHPLRRGRLRPHEQHVHARAATERLAVGGKPVVAYRWGDGARPVLLLHGWQSRASRFAPLVPRLQALGMTPIAFDAPGHGESGGRTTHVLEYRELAFRLQERYGDFEAVVAHSLGVNAAFLALRGGLRAGRLVAVAGAAEVSFMPAAFCAAAGLNARVERRLRQLVEREMFPGVEDVAEYFDATRHPAEIAVPILVAHDEGDDVVPVDHAHRLKSAYGDRLELLVTRGLGHRRILGEPAVLDNAVGFLAAADRTAGAA